MTTPAQVEAFWGPAGLVRWSRADLERAPAAARTYLAEVGLPAAVGLTLTFGDPPDLPALPGSPGSLVLGHDDEAALCLEPDGRVACHEPGGLLRPVNADVEALGESLLLYETYRREVRGMDDDEAEALIDRIEAGWRDGDPVALDDPDSYWSVILEQMRDGLL